MKTRLFNSPAPVIEPLEARIAPALTGVFSPAIVGSAILLDADPTTAAPQGLSATQDGPFLLYVEKGSALVFTKDLNLNNRVDFNEITGIAAGNGLSLISFVDIHGDIVTNLNADGTLTDSDNNAANGRDGDILLNSRIDKIEMRSVTTADLQPGEPISDRIALSSYSIFGNIYAGGGFGTPDGLGGLIIDDSGKSDQATAFDGTTGSTVYVAAHVQIGSIRVGTAASGQQFGFGASAADGIASGVSGADVRGVLQTFIPPANSPGADINGVHAVDPTTTIFNLNTLQAGDGGFNGRGGNVSNVQVAGDFAGGYSIIAGNASAGPTGPAGGSIINFSDIGSIGGGQILLQTGNGGDGLLKRGGDGGSLTLDPATPINMAGHIVIKLGDGGTGLTGGGNGGSQPSGTFTTPETVVPFGLQIVSSTHSPGDIFNQISTDANGVPLAAGTFGYHATRGFDFDGDGINDTVYTTKQSDQLVVLFGDPGLAGTYDHLRTIYLDSPANALAVTVGDFNGDGHPDIATASDDPSYAGVTVFLSKYDPLTGAFQGFRDPVYSALPSLGGMGYGAVVGTTLSFVLPGNAKQTAYQISDITSGDFDHDGVIDLAVVTSIGMIPMRGDAQDGGVTSGHFYVDSARNNYLAQGFANPSPDQPFWIPVDIPENGSFSALRPSALKDGGQDHLFVSKEGDKSIVNFNYDGGVLLGTGIGLGKVDTDRKISDPTKPSPDHITLQDVTLRDFTILDVNGDGNADIVALSLAPGGFLVSFQGDGTGVFTKTSDRKDNQGFFNNTDNSGIKIGGEPVDGGLGLNIDSLIKIVPANTDGNALGQVNDITIIDYQTDSVAPGTHAGIHIIEFSFQPIVAATNYIDVTEGDTWLTSDPYVLQGDESIRAFDTYVPNSAVPSQVTYTYLQAFKDDRRYDFVETFDVLDPNTGVFVGGYVDSLEDNTFFLTAGHGGKSSNGAGGAGGTVGTTLKIDPTTLKPLGSIALTLPAQDAYEANVRFISGDGGDGFTSGGAAGDLKGISMDYAVGTTILSGRALLFAGDGGDSTNGHAGRGGDLNSVSIVTGSYFVAGDGGNGKYGGIGGSVLGNPKALVDTTVTAGVDVAAGNKGDIENSQTATLVVRSGVGGSGTKAGGNGGAISGFTPRFLPIIGTTGGLLDYVAGAGGSSVGGAGGRGGSVLDSAPVTEGNNLSGDIFVEAGNGGEGKIGGVGGSIVGFLNSSAPGINVTSMTFLAGDGGQGIGGNGGVGGAVSKVAVSGTGVGFKDYFDFSHPEDITTAGDAFIGANPLPYARIVAGNGGDSIGAAGGAGGTLSGITATASSSALAVIAGRGGDGLTLGGLGGSVLTSSLGAAGTAKILVAAGDGGDAYGSAPSPANPLGFGGVNGRGGNGGSITTFSQPIGQDVNVDLIAGNGGNTINSGSSLAAVTKVGNGGSITNAQLTGSIGKGFKPVDASVAIRAYNDQSFGETFADVVAAKIVGDSDNPAFVLGNLLDAPSGAPQPNDVTGNVGIVVGAKGRVQDNNHDGVLDPSTSGINGSLINVHARSIMSAVAGSVERIASIRVLSNVGVTAAGGAFGSDKTVDSGDLTIPKAARVDRGASGDGVIYHTSDAPSLLDYLTANDTYVIVPPSGGRLVDGAIFADTVRPPQSSRDF